MLSLDLLYAFRALLFQLPYRELKPPRSRICTLGFTSIYCFLSCAPEQFTPVPKFSWYFTLFHQIERWLDLRQSSRISSGKRRGSRRSRQLSLRNNRRSLLRSRQLLCLRNRVCSSSGRWRIPGGSATSGVLCLCRQINRPSGKIGRWIRSSGGR